MGKLKRIYVNRSRMDDYWVNVSSSRAGLRDCLTRELLCRKAFERLTGIKVPRRGVIVIAVKWVEE